MTPSLRSRARRERRAREMNYALLGFYRSTVFPFLHPLIWLQARYFACVYGLYYSDRLEAAFRVARLWPTGQVLFVESLHARRMPVLEVFL